MWSLDKVWFLRHTQRTNPEEFERLRNEYFNTRATDFCNKYNLKPTTVQDAFWPRPKRSQKKFVSKGKTQQTKVFQMYWPDWMVKFKKEEKPKNYWDNPNYWIWN